MSSTEKYIHSTLLGIVCSFITWLIVDNLFINIPFWKYFIIELILVAMLKLYTFTITKLGLNQ
jgi:hypothetical protein